MAKPWYNGPWQRIRPTILQRDAFQCQIRAAGCTSYATQVDHITPINQGGAWWHPSNLQAACPNCNNQKADNTPTPPPRSW